MTGAKHDYGVKKYMVDTADDKFQPVKDKKVKTKPTAPQIEPNFTPLTKIKNIKRRAREKRRKLEKEEESRVAKQRQQSTPTTPKPSPRIPWKTKKCKQHFKNGHCPLMDLCVFAHSDDELRNAHDVSTKNN